MGGDVYGVFYLLSEPRLMSEGALFDRSSFNLEGVIQAQAQLHYAYLLRLQLRVSLQVSDADVERRTFRFFLNDVARAWF